MIIERQNALEIVFVSIETINKELQDEDKQLELKEETRLFGKGSKLDSLGLVTLIVDTEQRLAEELGTEVSLMDERAMSQVRSPFRSVRSLVDYICSLEV